MISPTVFLTAAYCDLGRAHVFVTFDSVAGGSLDALRVGQPFTSVGYGGQEPVNPQSPGGPFIAYQDTREFSGGRTSSERARRTTNVIYRLDTEPARSFLGRFVKLP